MANQSYIDSMQGMLDALREIEEERLMRSFLGGDLPLSENETFVGQRKKIEQRMEIAIRFGREVSDIQMQHINSAMERIVAIIREQSDLENRAYIDNQPSFLLSITSLMEEVDSIWMPFAACLAEYTYSTDGVHAKEKQIEEFAKNRMDEIRREADQIRERAEDTSTNIMEKAREEADNIMGDAKKALEGARLTATGQSVEGAQEQFREAQKEININVIIWAVLSVVGIATFALFAVKYTPTDIPEEWKWSILYHSTIKISILAIIGTVTSFFVKTFRAYLYMSAKNKHRIRVTNSIEAFLGTAHTADQRDLILSQLVDAVTQFGTSGLLSKEEDSPYNPKITLESIMKNISTKPPQ